MTASGLEFTACQTNVKTRQFQVGELDISNRLYDKKDN